MGVERTELEAKEDSLHGQATLRGRYAHIRRIISRHLFASSPNDHRDNEWKLVYGIDREDEYWSTSGLFASLNRIQFREVDFSTSNAHGKASRPSNSVTANSAWISRNSFWIAGSLAIS